MPVRLRPAFRLPDCYSRNAYETRIAAGLVDRHLSDVSYSRSRRWSVKNPCLLEVAGVLRLSYKYLTQQVADCGEKPRQRARNKNGCGGESSRRRYCFRRCLFYPRLLVRWRARVLARGKPFMVGRVDQTRQKRAARSYWKPTKTSDASLSSPTNPTNRQQQLLLRERARPPLRQR